MAKVQDTQETLTLHMDGLPSDGGDMRLAVFSEKLNALRMALQKTDEFLGGGDSALDFLVSDLKHESPSQVGVRAQSIDANIERQQQVFQYFSSLIAEVSSDAYKTAAAGHSVLLALKDLIGGYGQKYHGMWLSYRGQVVSRVSIETIEHINDLLEKKYTSLGSVKGRVEKYNSHGEAKNFHIFPAIGGRVKCIFNDDQKEITGEFVNKNAIVHGILKYREGDFFPYEVIVQSMEKIESDDKLQTLTGLYGIAPGATGNLDAVEFIKNNRNGWH